MSNFLILILSYFYHFFKYYRLWNFQKIFIKKNDEYNFGYLGLFGIFFLIIYSYISNAFIPHSKLHNFIILFFGFLFFITNLLISKKTNFKKANFIIFYNFNYSFYFCFNL